jgi:hypothetical protein
MSWLPDPDTVQLMSLPIEIVGLFFAAIEIYRPQYARVLEAIFDFLGEGLFHLLLGKQYKEAVTKQGLPVFLTGQLVLLLVSTAACYFLWSHFRNCGMSPLLLMSSGLLASAVTGVLLGLGRGGMLFKILFTLLTMILFAPMYILGFAIIILLWPVEWLFALFNWMTKGHAIGGLGLTLTLLGLCGEVYQVSEIQIGIRYIYPYWGGVMAVLLCLCILLLISRWMVRKTKATDLSGFNQFVRKRMGLPPLNQK